MFERIRDKLQEYQLISLVVLVIIVIGAGFALMKQNLTIEETPFPDVQAIAKEQPFPEIDQESSDEDENKAIMVDIKGAVKKTGVYQLEEGQRVTDLIDMAGGLLTEADPKSINLAQKLTDEAVIYVAYQGEEISVTQETVTSNSQTTKVNINKATLSELQTITGIGAKRAQDIIDYRDSSGGFKSLEDLKNVSGIGDKTFEKIQEEISLD